MPIEFPKKMGVDKLITLVKAISGSCIPGAELLLSFIKLPYQKRVDNWQKEVSNTLNELKSSGISLADLENNEEFLDILIQAIQIGIRHHQEEKRRTLRNAILHSALEHAPNFNIQQIFLNYIDNFTVWHINLLTLMSHPAEIWLKNNKVILGYAKGVSLKEDIIEVTYPELKENRDIVDSILNDLRQRNLLKKESSFLDGNPISDHSWQEYQKLTTNLGDEFIKFISA